LFSWLKSGGPSVKSLQASRDRAEIERDLRAKERDLRAEAPTEATPELRGYLTGYLDVWKEGPDDEIAGAEQQLTRQLEREADEYREHDVKYNRYYRVAVLVVGLTCLALAIIAGIAVAGPIISKLFHEFQGDGKVAATRVHPSGHPADVSMSPHGGSKNESTRKSPSHTTPTARSVPSHQSPVTAVTPPASKSRKAAHKSTTVLCISCTIETVTSGASQILSGVSPDVNGAVNDLTNTANSTVNGLTSTVGGTVNGLLGGDPVTSKP